MQHSILNLIKITYKINVNKTSSGTCFTLSHKNKHYLITAKHIFDNQKNPILIEIETDTKLVTINSPNLIMPNNQEVDIIAIEIPSPDVTAFNFVNFVYSAHGLPLGADILFFGYPYNLQNVNIQGLNRGMAIIKKAMVSGPAYDSSKGHIGFLLDGHNNPGFSGGPCFTKFGNTLMIFGVISSYVLQQEILYDDKGRQRMILQENSGIINAHEIDAIMQKL